MRLDPPEGRTARPRRSASRRPESGPAPPPAQPRHGAEQREERRLERPGRGLVGRRSESGVEIVREEACREAGPLSEDRVEFFQGFGGVCGEGWGCGSEESAEGRGQK